MEFFFLSKREFAIKCIAVSIYEKLVFRYKVEKTHKWFKTMKKYLLAFALLSLFVAKCPLTASPSLLAASEDKQEMTIEGKDGEELVSVSYEKTFVKMIFTLVALIAFIILTFWFLRRISQARMGQFSGSKRIKVLERRPISPKSVLYLVEIGGKKVLVAESHLEVRKIALVEEVERVE